MEAITVVLYGLSALLLLALFVGTRQHRRRTIPGVRRMFSVAAMFCVASLSHANTITVGFVGPSTGANNGVDYVGPYNLLVDGIPALGTCIDASVEVASTWQAYFYDPSEAAQPLQTELQEAQWLNAQFSSSPDWVGIHQAIWDIFGAAYGDLGTLAWLSSAQANYSSIDPSSFSLLQPVPDGSSQRFLVETAPEPTMFGLVGLALIGLGWKRWRT